MFSLGNILLTIAIIFGLIIIGNGIVNLAEDGLDSLTQFSNRTYIYNCGLLRCIFDSFCSWVVSIGIVAILFTLALAFVYGLTHLDEIEQNGKHQGETYQCLRYETKVTTRKRIISLTDTYDTYEEKYCAEYGWVKNEE